MSFALKLLLTSAAVTVLSSLCTEGLGKANPLSSLHVLSAVASVLSLLFTFLVFLVWVWNY